MDHAERLAEAERFLTLTCPQRDTDRREFVWGEGDDYDVAVWEEPNPEVEMRRLAHARAWRARRFDEGFGWLDGPQEYGGAGLDGEVYAAYRRLEARFEIPDQSFFKLDKVLGPVFERYGSERLRKDLLPALFRGDAIGCELFSEPEAGSDLAAVRTRAVRSAAGWCVSGQKVWTSDAHYATVGLALCRTGSIEDRHRGLTAFAVDMTHPGVEVRPLRQMTGGSAFNEVFLADVEVPDECRVGEVGEGWRVFQDTLRLERNAIGLGLGRGGAGIANGVRLRALARELGMADDPVVRDQLIRVYAGFRAAKWLGMVTQADTRAGVRDVPGPMLAKLALTRNTRAASAVLSELLAARLGADTGEWGTFAWTAYVLGEPGLHITAGTDEILRTVAAEQLLGLPKEVRSS